MSDIQHPEMTTAFRAGQVPHGNEALLDAARLSSARRQTTWPQRKLSGSVRLMLWALRVYLLLMLAVVAVQVARLT